MYGDEHGKVVPCEREIKGHTKKEKKPRKTYICGRKQEKTEKDIYFLIYLFPNSNFQIVLFLSALRSLLSSLHLFIQYPNILILYTLQHYTIIQWFIWSTIHKHNTSYSYPIVSYHMYRTYAEAVTESVSERKCIQYVLKLREKNFIYFFLFF